jgi:ankyrin repeat protein
MLFSNSKVRRCIEQGAFEQLDELLSRNSELANEGITIPFEFFCRTKAHPLHRICDPLISGKLSDDDALRFAKILIKHGSRIEGDRLIKGADAPLLAAASLHAEKVGIYLIEKGADVNTIGDADGANALHWSAFCGRDLLVKKLLEAGADFSLKDKNHNCTPLHWAIHCLMSNDEGNIWHQYECVKLLFEAGATVSELDAESIDFLKSGIDEYSFLAKYLPT